MAVASPATPTGAGVAGPPAGYTGSPGDGQNCASCHSSSVQTITGVITSNIPASGYMPNQTYTITASLSQTGINRFGFQISPQNTSGTKLGSLIVTNSTETSLSGSGKYIQHKSPGTLGSATGPAGILQAGGRAGHAPVRRGGAVCGILPPLGPGSPAFPRGSSRPRNRATNRRPGMGAVDSGQLAQI